MKLFFVEKKERKITEFRLEPGNAGGETGYTSSWLRKVRWKMKSDRNTSEPFKEEIVKVKG